MTTHTRADAPVRVALVSARPLFARGFGRLLGTLRPALEIVRHESLASLDAAAETPAGGVSSAAPDVVPDTARRTAAPNEAGSNGTGDGAIASSPRGSSDAAASESGAAVAGRARQTSGTDDAASRARETGESDAAISGGATEPAGPGTAAIALVLLDAAGIAFESLLDALERADLARVVVVLDETDDGLAALAMERGAAGVMVKAAPPGVLAEWLDALLGGERVRPAPSVALGAESLPPALRRRLSARRQKLLRLQLGGHSIGETARLLGLTPAKVVTELRVVMDIVRGRDDGL